jgi:hypothetical protein
MTRAGAVFAGFGVLMVVALGVVGYLAQRERRSVAVDGREPYRFGSWFVPGRVRREELTPRGWRYVQATRVLTLAFWIAFAVWLALRLLE